MAEHVQSKYPMSFEEFVNRIWGLFIERGNEKKYWHYFTDDSPYLKDGETRLDSWYSQFCNQFDEYGNNHFTDEHLIERIFQIEFKINFEKGNYPMTEDEFIIRVKELYLEYSTWDMDTKLGYINSEQGLEDMKDEYKSECYSYDQHKTGCYSDSPNICFTDDGLIHHALSLDKLTEFY